MTLQQDILLDSLVSQYKIELVRYYARTTKTSTSTEQAVLQEIKRQIHEIVPNYFDLNKLT